MDNGFSIDLKPLAERQAGDLKTPLLVLIARSRRADADRLRQRFQPSARSCDDARREVGIRSALAHRAFA